MRPAAARADLAALAAAAGVQRSYTDTRGRRRTASDATLAAVLTVLGHDVGESGQGAHEELRRLEAEHRGRMAQPVAVAWGRAAARIPLGRHVRGRVEWTVALEAGGELRGRTSGGGVLRLPPLPHGYHHVHLTAAGAETTVLLLCAPRRAFAGPGRSWGVFLPLYALPGPFGPGDLTGMHRLAAFIGELGGDLVGSTPLHAAFLDRPYEPSPYAPVSRLHWNELFVDPAAAPELETAPRARKLLAAVAPADGALVDYRGAMAAKRRVLEALLAGLGGSRLAAFERHLRDHPDLKAYAEFRARCEQQGTGWRDWQDPAPPGDPHVARYHAYAQWLCSEQLEHVAAGGAGPYLDMPLGVHPAGYDTWRFRGLFAEGASVGAPPDDFFQGGQDWGFPPLHPGRLHERRLDYPIACIRTICRHASAVRIDHVMGLHRIFVVPHGLPATAGVYLRYPAEELYAVLCIESNRHGTRLVGEDMGTVPAQVRRAMAAHGLLRTFAVQAELGHGGDPFARVPEAAMVGMNTHDMPTFAGFWECDADADGRRETLRAALAARGDTATDGPGVLDSSLQELAASRARSLMLNLEDLWWERERQNVPGTTTEQPNWRRRAHYGVDDLPRVPGLVPRLRRISELRGSER